MKKIIQGENMNKIGILDQEKLKSKVLLNNISNCLNNINYKNYE